MLRTHGFCAPDVSNYSSSKRHRTSQAGLKDCQSSKPIRRRAVKACTACRVRKVRCDAMQRCHVAADWGVPCSNCTINGIKCVIRESKSRKNPLDNSQPTTSAPITTLRIDEAARTEGYGIFKPSDVTNLVQASVTSDRVRKFCKHSSVSRHITLPRGLRFSNSMRPDFQGSGMVDIGIPVKRQPENDVYNALCARTTFDSDDDTDGFCLDRIECSAVQLEEELNGNINMVGENDIDLNDFLNFDSTANELWDVTLEEVANKNWWGLGRQCQ